MTGERAFTAWHHYNHVKESAVGATPGIFPFTYAAQEVKNLQREQWEFPNDPAPHLPPEEYEACYRDALWERDPGLAEDVFRYLDIMDDLVGRVCSINFLNTAEILPFIGMRRRTFLRAEPIKVVASGLKPVFAHEPFPTFFTPVIEVVSADEAMPAQFPGNLSWPSEGTYVYPWSRVRGITVME